MHSMTGYGHGSVKSDLVQIEVTVKSVNSRYLDVKIYGPRIYQQFESQLKADLREILGRGSIELSISRRGGQEKIFFNEALAQSWLQGLRKLNKKLNIMGEITPDMVLHIPDLYRVEDDHKAIKSEGKHLQKAFQQAVSMLITARRREGSKLKKVLSENLSQLKKVVVNLKTIRKRSLVAMKDKFTQKLARLPIPADAQDARFAQEAVLLVDKADISEELSRLETHLLAIKKLLNENASVGKRLDFFAQELLREANTIGSKSYAAELTEKVVLTKDLIEKFREQVQNIE